MRSLFHLIIFFIFLFTAGCASTVYKHVNPESDKGDGFRFHQSSPYLLVYTNGKGGIVTQILYIADPTKLVSAKPKNFLSKTTLTLELENGVLNNSKTDVDATIVPSAIIKAAQSVATTLLAANDPQKGNAERSIPAPQLYKIVVKGAAVSFVGSENTTEIKVDLLPQDAEKTKPAP